MTITKFVGYSGICVLFFGLLGLFFHLGFGPFAVILGTVMALLALWNDSGK